MSAPAGVVVLSHLFPSRVRPHAGPFVADQVRSLARDFSLTVVSPVRWVPVAPWWRAERDVPRFTDLGYARLVRPRVLAVPGGGLASETRLWPTQLRRHVRRAAELGNAGLLHAHFGIPDGVAGAALARELGLPFVITLWGSDAMVYPGRRALRKLLEPAISGAERIFAVSAPIADAAIELGADPARVCVVAGGIPDDCFGVPRSEARTVLGLDPDVPLILWVGRFVPIKQPAIALRAFSALPPDVRLVMVGAGPLRQSVEREVHALSLGDRVRIVGPQSRAVLRQWQSAATVALNSSSSEGTPLTLCEALACGTPLVSFPVGGIPDIIGTEQRLGTLAAGFDAGALSDALRAELQATRDSASLIRASERYRLSAVLMPIREAYGRALAS